MNIKILPFIYCFSILTFSFFLNTVAQNITHQDELIYYTTIAAQVKDATPNMQGLWGQVQQSVMTAGENKSHQLDRAGLDNLKNASAQNINDLERKIRAVSALHETDPDLNLKESCINLFTDAKNIQQSAMPQILAVLEKGIDKINSQQTSTLKSFLSKGQDLQYKLRDIQNLFTSFQNKHNITGEELRKFGL